MGTENAHLANHMGTRNGAISIHRKAFPKIQRSLVKALSNGVTFKSWLVGWFGLGFFCASFFFKQYICDSAFSAPSACTAI